MRRAAALLLLAAAAGAQTLAWKRAAQDWYEPKELTLLAEPPKGVASAGEGLFYFAGPCADQRLLLALSPEAHALRVDLDFDGDLADEAPVEMVEEGIWRRSVVEMDVPEPVAFSFFRRANGPRDRLWLAILAHREGTVVVEGRARRVLLLDHDQDLRFDGAEDRTLVDIDGDGLVNRHSDDERVAAGVPFRLRGSSYVAAWEGAGGRDLAIRPSSAEAAPRPGPWRPAKPPRPRSAPGGRENLEDLVRQYEGDRDRKGAPALFGGWAQRGLLDDIGRLGTPEAFAYLHRVYRREKDDGLVLAAVRAMGYRSYADRGKDVAAIARGGRAPAIRCAAIDALHYMDAPGREETLGRLLGGEQDEEVFRNAAQALGWLGTPEAFRLLDEAALRASPLTLRVHAYDAATRWRTLPPPAAFVVAAARQPDPRLRALALRDATRLDLAEARDLACEAARAGSLTPELMLAVTEILGAHGDAGAVSVLLPFADGATPALRGRLLDLLRSVRDADAVAAIAKGLDAASPPVRALSADILREIPGQESAILDRLRKERQEPALTALIRAAGNLKLAGAAGPIADALRRRPDDETLEQAGLRALAEIGFSSPDVVRFVTDRMASTDWLERLSAVDCAVQSGDPGATPLLAGRLKDPVWQVRISAAHGLGVVRAKESVPALISALGSEERLRIRKTIGESLFRLTGEDFGDTRELWERWWREHGDGFELPAKAPERKEAPRGGERRTVATFYGVPVDSDRVVFVLDVSSSMGRSGFGEETSELDRAVKETLKVVKALPPSARANVVVFETEIRTWKRGLTTLGTSARKALERFLSGQRPSGSTNLHDALETALLMRDVETIYLLSDGEPTAGRVTGDDEIVEAVRRLNRDTRAAVHCVSLGGDSRLLRRIAEATMGTYVQR